MAEPSKRTKQLGGSIFFGLLGRAEQARARGVSTIPLHIGDSALPPPDGTAVPEAGGQRLELHRYGAIAGDSALIDLTSKRYRARGLEWVSGAAEVQITSGATHALLSSMIATLDPGDEVLLPSPFWPLIRGVIVSSGAVPIETPLLREDGTRADLISTLSAHISPRTRGLYLANPNNPDGYVYGHAELRSLVEFARKHDLWIYSDEVYDEMIFAGSHVSIATIDGARERTCVVGSVSKSYAQCGLRVGFVTAPAEILAGIRRVVTHSVYNVPVAMQWAAAKCLASGPAPHRAHYQLQRDLVFKALSPLGVATVPAGPFVFMPIANRFGPNALNALADAGVLLTPGDACGSAYAGWGRLCFTSIGADVLAEGCRRIVEVLGGKS